MREKDAAAVDIRVVFGPGGVGKTSLVIHAVQSGAAEFPDGQLYVDLQGYGPNALSPSEVLNDWLRDLGVDERLIPAAVTERSRTFRSRMAGRRAAVVLDNAGGEDQVRPLLVAGGGCVTFITSREPLGGLAVSARIQLDGLSVPESVELLSRILGEDRIQREATTAQQLASASGGLPLALRVLGGRLVSETRPLAAFMTRLDRRRAERQFLSEFTFGDLSVEATFALSREHLPEKARQAFDMLGLHPADEWPEWSVAALCECSIPDAQTLLERLGSAQLVKSRVVPDTDEIRFYLHDLVRQFAMAQAVSQMTAESRASAVRRLASAYLAMADLADERIHPGGVRHQGRTQAPRYPLDPDATRYPAADPFGWFRMERESIGAIVAECHRIGAWQLCWELSDAASVALENLRIWDTGQRSAELALDATGHLESRPARAAILRNLGEIDRELGERDRAIARLEESVRIFGEVGDDYGAIDAGCNLGLVHLRWGDPLIAEGIFSTALSQARGIGDSRGEAWTLEILGECAMVRTDRPAGIRYLEEAIALFKAAGERRGEAFALSNQALLTIDDIGWAPLPPVRKQTLGAARSADAERAAILLEEATKIFDVLGDSRNLAMVAVARIRIEILLGNDRDARTSLREARSMEGFDLDWRLRGLLGHCEAVVDHRSGSLASARARCEEALSLVRPFGDRLSTACMTLHLGLLIQGAFGSGEARARFEEAAGLFGELRSAAGTELCRQILADPDTACLSRQANPTRAGGPPMDLPPTLSVRSRDLTDGLAERRYLFAEHRLDAGGELPLRMHPHDCRTFIVTGGCVLLEQPGPAGQVWSRGYRRLEGWHATPASVYCCRNVSAGAAVVLETGSVSGSTVQAGSAPMPAAIASCLDLSSYIVRKPWGHEIWYTENLPEPSYAVKQIHMHAGHRSSLQSHRRKAETNWVIDGEATVLNGVPAPGDADLTVNVAALPLVTHPAGTGWSSAPNMLHRVIAESAYTAIEVSSPELDDVIRWADDTGRSHGRIQAEHDGDGR